MPPAVLKVGDKLTDRDKQQIKLIQQLIRSYFKIVQKNLQDYVTKIIMTNLVNQSKTNIQRDLVGELYKDELFDNLLVEDSTVIIKRRVAVEHLDALKKAKKIVQAAELKDLTGGI